MKSNRYLNLFPSVLCVCVCACVCACACACVCVCVCVCACVVQVSLHKLYQPMQGEYETNTVEQTEKGKMSDISKCVLYMYSNIQCLLC